MSLTNEEIQRHIWRNTISNYVCVVFRLFMGLVIVRLLWQLLPDEEMGFWAILWSVFGYGILLDFGFGFAAQKRVAECAVHEDWEELSRVLSTIFFTYVCIGAGIIAVGVLGADWLIEMFEITARNREAFKEVLIIFFCGLGLAFPLGLFPEILRGLHRISLANYVLLGGMILNFLLAATALYGGWGLKTLIVIALATTFLPDLACGFLAQRFLPNVRIRLRYFSRAMISKTMSFSLFAYVITVSNLILTKTDNLVIGTMIGVAAVKIYYAGAKVCEMFYAFTQQLPETLSPAAAHHHAKGDRGMLQELLINGTRFSVMISTPLYCITALFMDGVLRILTGEKALTSEVFWVAQILLLWAYNMVVTQSVSKRIFVMCGHERRLMWLSVCEAVVNLGASVLLVMYFRQVWCVAAGSLISSVFFGWMYLWPWSAREASLSGWRLARTVLLPAWAACIPLLAVGLVVRTVPALNQMENVPLFLIESSLAMVIAIIGVWKLAMTDLEREKLGLVLSRFISRAKAKGA